MEWRADQRRPERVTTTTFQALMKQQQNTRAINLVLTNRPSLKNLS